MQTLFLPFPSLPLVRDPATYWKRYQKYLRSTVWAYVRRMTMELADYTCQLNKPGCTGRATEVHHTTYLFWSRGMDRPGEHTLAICRNCHRWAHARPMTLPNPANDNFEFFDEVASGKN